MENKINIAELLKDCPQGMELDCTMFENPVKYMGLTNSGTYIKIKTSYDKVFYLTKEGYMFNMADSKCVIFPKGKTTWEGFVPPCKFKDGDVLYIRTAYRWICIYKEGGEKENVYHRYVAISASTFVHDDSPLCHRNIIKEIRRATEEEKEKLFKVIKDNGYNWNAETKTLEKLVVPKFKVGNKITNGKISITIGYIDDEYYYEVGRNIATRLSIKNQDEWNLIPHKFDINTLIPFESKVLVRHNKDNKWTGSFFSFIDRDLHSHCYKFVTTADKSYPMMIPFKGNEYLLGKTDDCQDFYKIWE